MERRCRAVILPLLALALALARRKLWRGHRGGSPGEAGPRAPARSRGLARWNYLLQYEPLRGLPFTPLVTCEDTPSALMERFDWKLIPASGFLGWQGKVGHGCSSVDDKPLARRPQRRPEDGLGRAPRGAGAAAPGGGAA
mmetsp:Transcript_154758/g.475474  ORF Transcript_154758/g.475474 Transcript_154758/m.475474 type:complete len:140 (-) Transcript_154758:139-558(-)